MIRGNERFVTQLYVIVDIFFILVGFFASWWIKFMSPFASSANRLPFHTYFLTGIIYIFIAVCLGYFFYLYAPKRKKTFANELLKLVQIHILALMFLISILYLFDLSNISRTFLFYFILSNLLFVGGYRLVVKLSLRSIRKKGFNKQYILVLGAGKLGKQYYENIVSRPGLGFDIFGFLDDYRTEHYPNDKDYKPILGKLEDLEAILSKHTIDEVVIALPLHAHDKYQNIVSICEKAGVRVAIIPDYYKILPARPHIDIFGDLPIINIRDIPLDEMRNRLFKRLFDITFSIAAITITLPLLFFIYVTIKITSPGPVIFKQERVGMNNRTFTMYKFRSMKVNTHDEANTRWTVENDPRRTAFGSFLRSTSLDELPQFFNVLKGDMSVVGPRPERKYFVDQFKEDIPQYMIKHHVRPGITGWAQVNGLRGDTSISKRISFDIFYIENWTFILDIKIIFKTIVNGFVNKNAY